MNCIYCEERILVLSKEHVIQNALGGLLSSEAICCSLCNNKIQRLIDDGFTRIFSPITTRVKNLKKTSNTTKKPSAFAFARYENNEYEVIIKGNKIVGCAQLSRELRRNLTKEDFEKFEIIGYKFDLSNNVFVKGISKIAVNYALHSGISSELLSKNIDADISNGELVDVEFKFPVIPYIAMNNFDWFIETVTTLELYHHLILFNVDKTLWCYVDLFNTFQFYVCLNEEWLGGNIYKSYCQIVETYDRHVPNIMSRKPKHLHMYSQIYGVESTLDIEVLEKRIESKFKKASYQRNIKDIIQEKTTLFMPFLGLEDEMHNNADFLRDFTFYLEDNEILRSDVYRRFTPSIMNKGNVFESYPDLILELLDKDKEATKKYTFAKFERLSKHISLMSPSQ